MHEASPAETGPASPRTPSPSNQRWPGLMQRWRRPALLLPENQALVIACLRPRTATLIVVTFLQARLRAIIGRPSVDPELMIRMLIVGYCYGIRSERKRGREPHPSGERLLPGSNKPGSMSCTRSLGSLPLIRAIASTERFLVATMGATVHTAVALPVQCFRSGIPSGVWIMLRTLFGL